MRAFNITPSGSNFAREMRRLEEMKLRVLTGLVLLVVPVLVIGFYMMRWRKERDLTVDQEIRAVSEHAGKEASDALLRDRAKAKSSNLDEDKIPKSS
jgi:hypothetical protein